MYPLGDYRTGCRPCRGQGQKVAKEQRIRRLQHSLPTRASDIREVTHTLHEPVNGGEHGRPEVHRGWASRRTAGGAVEEMVARGIVMSEGEPTVDRSDGRGSGIVRASPESLFSSLSRRVHVRSLVQVPFLTGA